MLRPLGTGASPEVEYLHRDGKGAWHVYDAATCEAIEASFAMQTTVSLDYPQNPEKYRRFESRHGVDRVETP